MHRWVFAVEGAWAVWGSWNTCSATCGTGTRSRARNFTGGMPCAGNANETESCQSKFWMESHTIWDINTQFSSSYKLREYGAPGILGEFALVYVIVMQLKVGHETSLEVQYHVMAVT